MKTHLEFIGILLIGLALIHAVFPRYFRWREELHSVSLVTRQILHVHTFFIALMVLLMGALCLTSARDLIETSLGRRVSGGMFVFWVARWWIQFFGYSPELWKGKRFGTAVHLVFCVLWGYLSGVFLLVSLGYRSV